MGFIPTSFISTMSRANVWVSSSAIMALPPYFTTMVDPWKMRGAAVDDSMISLGMVLALIFIAVIAIVIFFQFIPFGLWLTALFSGIRVSFFTLFGMRFRRVDPRAIVLPLISGHKAGVAAREDD